MKLIKPYFEIIEQESGLEGIYKQIELAGRTCYKSEDKITPDSAKGFVDRMIKSGHGAMLEHGTVYLKADSEFYNPFIQPEDGEEEEYNDLFKYGDNNYSVCHEQRSVNGNTIYVTTNLRVLVENNWLDDLQYLCEPTEFHEKESWYVLFAIVAYLMSLYVIEGRLVMLLPRKVLVIAIILRINLVMNLLLLFPVGWMLINFQNILLLVMMTMEI